MSKANSQRQSTHHEDVYIPQCKDDITFQVSTSFVEAHWMIGDNLKPYITHVLWSLEEEDYSNSTLVWTVVIDSVDVGLTHSHRNTNLFLKDGGHYRSVVTLCHTTVCFESRESDGFWVITKSPVPGGVTVGSPEFVDDEAHFDVQFDEFTHQYRVEDDVHIHYQWALLEKIPGKDENFITKWQTVTEGALFTVNGKVCETYII